MLAIITLLVVATLIIVTVKIASRALILTGMSQEVAKMQAMSALTSTGFTTKESEMMVAHPIRRRILFALMLLSNVGFITISSSLVISFMNNENGIHFIGKVIFLIAGLVCLAFFSFSKRVDNFLDIALKVILKEYSRIDLKDYARLLKLSEDYTIVEMEVDEDHWMVGKTLTDMQLTKEGIMILGIQKLTGEYIGTPHKTYAIEDQDLLIIYGKDKNIELLRERKKGSDGDQKHQEEVENFKKESEQNETEN